MTITRRGDINKHDTCILKFTNILISTNTSVQLWEEIRTAFVPKCLWSRNIKWQNLIHLNHPHTCLHSVRPYLNNIAELLWSSFVPSLVMRHCTVWFHCWRFCHCFCDIRSIGFHFNYRRTELFERCISSYEDRCTESPAYLHAKQLIKKNNFLSCSKSQIRKRFSATLTLFYFLIWTH